MGNIMETKLSLKELQDGLFEMLKVFSDLCNKHNIEYFLDSGTLLGAVRHKDFIPWDDDTDVSMKRSEFEKFKEIANELPSPYKFVDYTDYGGHFFDFVPRIINTEFSIRAERDYDAKHNGYTNKLALDIFILDSASENVKEHNKTVFAQKKIYGYGMAHRCFKQEKHSFIDRLKIFILSLKGKTLKLNKIYEKQETLSKELNDKDTGYLYCSNYIMSEIHIRYPAKCFESAILLPVKDVLFSCPSGYDKVLTILYGDYMTPPPEKDRQGKHIDN